MSVELLLIPVGIAAFAAWKEGRSPALCERCRSTAIKDQSLLAEALLLMGASDLEQTEGRLQCRSRFGNLTFQRIGETFLGRVDGRDTALTNAMLDQLAADVGRVAQARSVALIREQAARMGMILLEETQQDGTVQLLFEAAS